MVDGANPKADERERRAAVIERSFIVHASIYTKKNLLRKGGGDGNHERERERKEHLAIVPSASYNNALLMSERRGGKTMFFCSSLESFLCISVHTCWSLALLVGSPKSIIFHHP